MNSVFTYTIEDNEVSITGLIKKTSDIKIPEQIDGFPVTEIAINSFSFQGLEKVDIPDSVTTIGMSAFIGNKLKSVKLPRNLESLGEYAFGTNELEEIEIFENLKYLSFTSFESNQLLRKVTVHEDNEYYKDINGKCLCDITGTNLILGTISGFIPDSVEIIGKISFSYKKIPKSLIIPDNVKTIGEFAFISCGINNLTLPDSVSRIDDMSFCYNNLRCIRLHENIKSVGFRSFGYNNIDSIIVEAKELELHYGAFENQKDINNLSIFLYSDLGILSLTSLNDGRSNSTVLVDKKLFSECLKSELSHNNINYLPLGREELEKAKRMKITFP